MYPVSHFGKMVPLTWFGVFISLFVLTSAFSISEDFHVEEHDEKSWHPDFPSDINPRRVSSSEEMTAEYWNNLAKERVRKLAAQELNTNMAKNVILFLGDGMSIPTVSAARIYKGQLEGLSGEEQQLSFEKFPVAGLSKTYCVDRQVADSATTATAYLCGVKANYGTIGVTAQVPRDSCKEMQNSSNHVHSIAKLFNDNGRSAGFVTTTRVTHASPSGTHANTANRDWESDVDIVSAGFDPLVCKDIAHQLIHEDPGTHFKVILGGGRREFRSLTAMDEEGSRGRRTDNRDLIEEWKELKANKKHEYVWNKQQLLNVKDDTDYLLGLFEADHCQYNLNTNKDTEPTFEEMVEAAIKVLSKNDDGFFLFAEGGRIDHAHHETKARVALDETVEFSKGIAKAVSMTSSSETLIVVTSDHAHTMSFSGYPSRGNPIAGVNDRGAATDKLKYLTLSYANGDGYRKEVNGNRVDVANEDIENPSFKNPALVPLDSETHGGDDVGVFAYGPYEHFFTGVYEQSTIPHIMAFASCLEDEPSAC